MKRDQILWYSLHKKLKACFKRQLKTAQNVDTIVSKPFRINYALEKKPCYTYIVNGYFIGAYATREERNENHSTVYRALEKKNC